MKDKVPILQACLIVFLVIAIFPVSDYNYYMLLKIIVCGGCGYLATREFLQSQIGWGWTLGIVAAIFNPIANPILEREIWMLIDSVAIIILCFHIVICNKRIKVVRKSTALMEQVESGDILMRGKCWVCGKEFFGRGCPAEIKMYGDAYYVGLKPWEWEYSGKYKYKKTVVNIPCCSDECHSKCMKGSWVKWIRNTSDRMKDRMAIGKFLKWILILFIGVPGIGTPIAKIVIGISKGFYNNVPFWRGILDCFVCTLYGIFFGLSCFALTLIIIGLSLEILSYLVWLLFPIAKIHDYYADGPKYLSHPEYCRLVYNGYRERLKDVCISRSSLEND